MNDIENDLQRKMKDLCQRVIDAQDNRSLMTAIRELNDYLETVNVRRDTTPLDDL